jgi:hypothetical protein
VELFFFFFMTNFQPIAQLTHSVLHWKRLDNYRFAAKDAVVPLAQAELQRACMVFPIALVERGGQFSPAAVLGLHKGHNLFVAPDGRWIGSYTPAAYRGHPFALGKHESGQQLLCVDAESGLVGPEGEDFEEPFFDDQGQPSASVKAVLYFLEQVQANRVVTLKVCALLTQEGLIEPWPITLKSEEGEQTEQTIQGLYRVSKGKFNALGAKALHRLHQAGALPLIYGQLLSMQHLSLLGKLADAHAKAKAHAQAQANAPLDFEQLLHASEALATAPGAHKNGVISPKNGRVSDDWNWSL